MQPLDTAHEPLLADFRRDASLVRVALFVSPT
jgi:hypothetical protein